MFQLIEISVQNIFFLPKQFSTTLRKFWKQLFIWQTIENTFLNVLENNFLTEHFSKRTFQKGFSTCHQKQKHKRLSGTTSIEDTFFHVWPLKHMASGGLVGGLEHFFFIYWEFHNPNWRNPSFFRGVGLIHPSTNQGNIVMTPWLWKPSSQSSQRRDIAHWDDWFKEPNKDGVSLWVYGMVTGYFHHIYNRLMGIHGG